MIERYRGGKVPEPGAIEKTDENIREGALSTVSLFETAMDEIAFHKALVSVWDYIALVNRYVDNEAPWVLAKENNEERLNTVLWNIVQSLGVVTLLIYPFMPESARELWRKLGPDEPLESVDPVPG